LPDSKQLLGTATFGNRKLQGIPVHQPLQCFFFRDDLECVWRVLDFIRGELDAVYVCHSASARVLLLAAAGGSLPAIGAVVGGSLPIVVAGVGGSLPVVVPVFVAAIVASGPDLVLPPTPLQLPEPQYPAKKIPIAAKQHTITKIHD
jgi:hypothetical protein